VNNSNNKNTTLRKVQADTHQIVSEDKFNYVDVGEGQVLLLLHGLFGALSNFSDLIDYFKDSYRVVIPILPIYDGPKEKSSIEGLLEFISEFVSYKDLKGVIPIGNSLGGHLALKYAVHYAENTKGMVITGSSGLFEDSLGDTYPKKSDYSYIEEKTKLTFYDPEVATKELVDEIFEVVNNREKAIRILYIARSAIRNNMAEDVPSIKVPSLLIWGKQDTITPPFVAEEFHKLLPDSSLEWIDKCGHAAMMERPQEFNKVLERFLQTKY